jgi:tetratricopeptide (TPR) repeat protein
MLFICFLLVINYSYVFALSDVFALSEFEGDAPDFTLNSLDDEVVSLSDFKGSIVVLVYWRTDQKRSLQAIIDLQGLHEKYKDKGVQVIGITAEAEQKESVIQIAGDNAVAFPILLDSEREVYGAFGVRVYPSTIIIDRHGKMAHGIPGHALSYKLKMDGRLQYMLGEISEEEFAGIMSPKKEVKDDALLKAQRRYNLALKFTGTRMYDQAVMMVKQAVTAKPDFVESYILLGFLSLEMNETEEAYDAFNKALEIDPESKDARTGLGSTLILKEDYDGAIEILTEAVSLNPYPERAYYELGRAYELKGDQLKSIEMYKKSLTKVIHKHILPSSITRCK